METKAPENNLKKNGFNSIIENSGRWQSGQLHETVNLAPSGYGGSNPSLPISYCRSGSVAERPLGKGKVESSILSFGSKNSH